MTQHVICIDLCPSRYSQVGGGGRQLLPGGQHFIRDGGGGGGGGPQGYAGSGAYMASIHLLKLHEMVVV